MNHPGYFRSNLIVLKQESQLSLTKFSEKLQMPKSTIQSVMENGQTSLDTACRIANALKIPLPTLTNGELRLERADVLHGTLTVLKWYCELPAERQRNIRAAFCVFLNELEK